MSELADFALCPGTVEDSTGTGPCGCGPSSHGWARLEVLPGTRLAVGFCLLCKQSTGTRIKTEAIAILVGHMQSGHPQWSHIVDLAEQPPPVPAAPDNTAPRDALLPCRYCKALIYVPGLAVHQHLGLVDAGVCERCRRHPAGAVA